MSPFTFAVTATEVALAEPEIVASAVGVERLIATAPATPVAVFTAVPSASAESFAVVDASTCKAPPFTMSESPASNPAEASRLAMFTAIAPATPTWPSGVAAVGIVTVPGVHPWPLMKLATLPSRVFTTVEPAAAPLALASAVVLLVPCACASRSLSVSLP